MRFGPEVSLNAGSPRDDAGPTGPTHHHPMPSAMHERSSHALRSFLCVTLPRPAPFVASGSAEQRPNVPNPKTFFTETFFTGMARARPRSRTTRGPAQTFFGEKGRAHKG